MSTQSLNKLWAENTRYFEYTSSVNPKMPDINVDVFPSSLHEITETKIIPLDLSKQLQTSYLATGPTLLANYIHINSNEEITSSTNASSQSFFVIRGSGQSITKDGVLSWKKGDYFALPYSEDLIHQANEDSAFYWVNDSPIMNYMGAKAQSKQCQAVYFSYAELTKELDIVRKGNEGKDLNRNGILLANIDTPLTKTLTHSMWSLYNMLPAHTKQKAHRHNSIALDYCVSAGENTYTLIGKRIDGDGNIINPIKAMWKPYSVFVTPPNSWHSHHNESNEDAIVLPVQDAGLQTYLQTLNIQFSKGY